MDVKDNSVRILEDMLLCSADCAGDFVSKADTFAYEEDLIDWLYRNLPTIPYVVDQAVNFIFSDGLTTGDDGQDEKLKGFLYARNIRGEMNYTVLRESVKRALVYGKHGIRWLDDKAGVVSVESKRYGTLAEENEQYYGFVDVVGYMVATDDRKIFDAKAEEITFEREIFERQGILIDKERKLMLIGKEDFLSLRNDPLTDDGDSPLKYDLQRTKLLAAIYERLNYDVRYDGPGRILLRLKDGWDNAAGNETSAGKILDTSAGAMAERGAKAKREAQLLGKEIKDSGSDSVVVVSNMFDKDITHLPRTTSLSDFAPIVENEGVIMSQVFGLPPALLNLGKISGNISMEKIIDNAMLNAVVPLRERFATQLSGFLAEKIGVGKIYFNKYEMAQAVDENDSRVKVVGMVEKVRRWGNDEDQEVADKMMENLDAEIESD